MSDNETNPNPRVSPAILKAIRERLPSKIALCEGCYGIDKVLTMKKHFNQIWTKSAIKIVENKETRSHVELRCKFCVQWRKVSKQGLTSVSWDFFMENWNSPFELFTLVKDYKNEKKTSWYIVLVGFDPKSKTLDLTDIVGDS